MGMQALAVENGDARMGWVEPSETHHFYDEGNWFR